MFESSTSLVMFVTIPNEGLSREFLLDTCCIRVTTVVIDNVLEKFPSFEVGSGIRHSYHDTRFFNPKHFLLHEASPQTLVAITPFHRPASTTHHISTPSLALLHYHYGPVHFTPSTRTILFTLCYRNAPLLHESLSSSLDDYNGTDSWKSTIRLYTCGHRTGIYEHLWGKRTTLICETGCTDSAIQETTLTAPFPSFASVATAIQPPPITS